MEVNAKVGVEKQNKYLEIDHQIFLGLLVSISVRLLLLAIGLWALFMRRSAATMPRIFLYRAVVLLLVTLCTFAYWLFYIVQVSNIELAHMF